MKKIPVLFFFCLLGAWATAQSNSPEDFLGYELGKRFTPHHRIVAYFEHVARAHANVQLQKYGETYEKRPLFVVYVSSEENISMLDSVRKDNLRRAGMLSGNPKTRIPITWLSYNVHGNEAVSSEAAMMTLWALVDPMNKNTKDWLRNNLVIIDPCLNPDGRDRYVNWYNQKMHLQLQPDPQSIEHNEPWPEGRANHYLFDLNRDWAWQVQKESQQRLKLYHQWMPQLHLDFHEQGVDQPYYFPPAAEPVHHQLSSFQLEFQEIFGRNTAKYFDQNNWMYFTKETFDLLYPSYGDTWPMYNGAIGMTIEQGGSGKAGIGVLTGAGDTLTLRDRILHHHTTGLSAIEIASLHAEKLVDEFEKYFSESSSKPQGKYKSFLIRGNSHPARVEQFLNLLDKNEIRYGLAGKEGSSNGFNYETGKQELFSFSEEDIVINVYQPKSILTQVLFEPEPVLNDSITYDITSWALPYAFGLEAFALETRLNAEKEYAQPVFELNETDKNTLAYIAPWNAAKHAGFLAAMVKKEIRVRYAEYGFEIGTERYSPGSLILTTAGNLHVENFHEKVVSLANQFEIPLGKTSTGYVDKGKDFGSSKVKTIIAPHVALIGGEGVSSLDFGELWHFFEQDLKYPLSILDQNQLANNNLNGYNVIILPSGNYETWSEKELKKIQSWVKSGGKLLVIGGALDFFADKEGFGLSPYYNDTEKKAQREKEKNWESEALTAAYQERERMAISEQVLGAVFEVKMDTTHALGFGTNGQYYTLKTNDERYAYLKKGINAGIIPSMDRHRTGFIGYKAKTKIEKSLAFGLEHQEKGTIIYLVDNPIFRGFWESGKLVLANALFLVQ